MLSTATTLIGSVLLAGTLSVDALSVSMSIGARMHGGLMPQHYRTAIAWFAGLHAVVYSLGFLLGDSLARVMNGVGAWVSFTLLVIVGAIIIRSAFATSQEDECMESIPPLQWKTLAPLAFACSIDASAVGSSVGLSGSLPYGVSVLMLGIVTALAVSLGLRLGDVAGQKWQRRAEVGGGLVLILLGVKALL